MEGGWADGRGEERRPLAWPMHSVRPQCTGGFQQTGLRAREKTARQALACKACSARKQTTCCVLRATGMPDTPRSLQLHSDTDDNPVGGVLLQIWVTVQMFLLSSLKFLDQLPQFPHLQMGQHSTRNCPDPVGQLVVRICQALTRLHHYFPAR